MPDSSHKIDVFQVTQLSDELFEACQRLVPQLSRSHPPPTWEQLGELLQEGSTRLFLARHADFGAQIIGMASLVIYRVPTGVRGYIEDVVVDERLRGRQIGEALTRACLDLAGQLGAPQVMLTSNPLRQAANRLYQRMGFELRKTNVYRYTFKKE